MLATSRPPIRSKFRTTTPAALAVCSTPPPVGPLHAIAATTARETQNVLFELRKIVRFENHDFTPNVERRRRRRAPARRRNASTNHDAPRQLFPEPSDHPPAEFAPQKRQRLAGSFCELATIRPDDRRKQRTRLHSPFCRFVLARAVFPPSRRRIPGEPPAPSPRQNDIHPDRRIPPDVAQHIQRIQPITLDLVRRRREPRRIPISRAKPRPSVHERFQTIQQLRLEISHETPPRIPAT